MRKLQRANSAQKLVKPDLYQNTDIPITSSIVQSKGNATSRRKEESEGESAETVSSILANVLRSSKLPLPAEVTPPPPELCLPPPIGSFEQPENAQAVNVAIVGIASAGKSTLINALIGDKVTIVSQRAQSTRERVLGILSQKNKQIVFMDTPGIATESVGKNAPQLKAIPWQAVDASDLIVAMVDAERSCASYSGKLHPVEMSLIEKIKEASKPTMLLLNKLDAVHHTSRLQNIVEAYKSLYPFSQVIKMSALDPQNVETVKNLLLQQTMPREWRYPPGQTTDIAELEYIEMLFREAIMSFVHGYIPYILTHDTVGWTQLSNGVLRIDHEVTVEKSGQKDIIAGKRNKGLYSIQDRVQTILTKRYGKPVLVYLRFKVRKS
jgi:GTP-binding protein Era